MLNFQTLSELTWNLAFVRVEHTALRWLYIGSVTIPKEQLSVDVSEPSVERETEPVGLIDNCAELDA